MVRKTCHVCGGHGKLPSNKVGVPPRICPNCHGKGYTDWSE